MDTVYIETTIVGHIAGRMHPDQFVAARQRVTRDWWENHSKNYAVFISELVIDECSAGDAVAAGERMAVIKDIKLLESSTPVDDLANALIIGKAIPETEPRDAFHIAIAAVTGVKYLLTWNFKHIANASLRGKINETCRHAGFEPPIICTPDELMGVDDGT